jgi:hypothetical protein
MFGNGRIIMWLQSPNINLMNIPRYIRLVKLGEHSGCTGKRVNILIFLKLTQMQHYPC